MSILPAEITKARSTADFGAGGICDPRRVYVTTDPLSAAMFAAMHPSGSGHVYKVVPLGDVIPDPDCREPNLSYSCDEAVIITRFKVPGKYMKIIRKALTRAHNGEPT